MAGLYLQLTTLVVVVVSIENIASAGQPQSCALKKNGLEDHLRLAGVTGSGAKTYSNIFRKQNIDEHILPKLTLDQLNHAGITALGDRLKISNYFANDADGCAIGNLCKNGGRCQDGFQCFRCLCPGDFYGPTCKSECPCKNSGKCVGNSGKLECKCIPGYTGVLCEKQWLSEDVFSHLEKKVKTLTQRLRRSELEITEQKKALAALKSSANRGWRLVRVQQDLNQLAKIALHQQTPTLIQKMPTLPKNTKAVILSVFINFGNRNGHAYLNFKTYQKSNEKNGTAIVDNTHFNVYANTFYYEITIPWNTTLPDELVFEITSSYLTGGSDNWHRIKLVGYITA